MTHHRKPKTPAKGKEFDFTTHSGDTMYVERRVGRDRRDRNASDVSAKSTNPDRPPVERRAKKERRRRIDPTTFEKQYTDDEIEFMNAMQRFKIQSGRSFPTYGEVLKVAYGLGYRKALAHGPAQAIEGPTTRPETAKT